MPHAANLRRLNKLEACRIEREQGNAGGYDWRKLAALPQEELLRLHAEHVDRPRTAQEEAQYERLRQLSAEELLRLHVENVR